MNLDDVKQLIKSGQIETDSEVIGEGTLTHTSGDVLPYKVSHGWNIASSLECDEKWGRSNLELFEYIREQDFDDNKLAEVLDSIQTEDHHWNWFKKSVGTTGDEYEWFYLYAEGEPQVAVLVKPKWTLLIDNFHTQPGSYHH